MTHFGIFWGFGVLKSDAPGVSEVPVPVYFSEESRKPELWHMPAMARTKGSSQHVLSAAHPPDTKGSRRHFLALSLWSCQFLLFLNLTQTRALNP